MTNWIEFDYKDGETTQKGGYRRVGSTVYSIMPLVITEQFTDFIPLEFTGNPMTPAELLTHTITIAGKNKRKILSQIGISYSSYYRYIRENKLPTRNINMRQLSELFEFVGYSEEDVDRYLEQIGETSATRAAYRAMRKGNPDSLAELIARIEALEKRLDEMVILL